MKPKNKKGVLITIIVLLVIFVPLSVFSFVLHVMEVKNPKDTSEPLNGEFHQNGKLNFYDADKNYLNSYPCENPNDFCDYATNTIEDIDYGIDYYKAKEGTDLKIKMIRDRYAFLIDTTSELNQTVMLFDIKEGRVLTKYNAVKDYGIGIENDLFIVKNSNNKYGVLSLEKEPVIKVKFEYDFLGLVNFVNKEEEKLMNDFFVGLQGNDWYLIDRNGAVLTESISKEIVSYNGKNIIVKDKTGYTLVDYDNHSLLGDEMYKILSFTGKYLNVTTTDSEFYVYDIATQQIVSQEYDLKSTDKIESVLNKDGNMEIILNGTVVETLSNLT